jgi:hypothetical protein
VGVEKGERRGKNGFEKGDMRHKGGVYYFCFFGSGPGSHFPRVFFLGGLLYGERVKGYNGHKVIGACTAWVQTGQRTRDYK